MKKQLLTFFWFISAGLLFGQNINPYPIRSTQSRLDTVKLGEIDKKIKSGYYGAVTSVVVYHANQTVFEKYYNGTKPNDLLTMRSGMKGITALLMGMAIKEQVIHSENDLVSPYFKNETNLNPDVRKNKITISDLLKMASGIEWHEDQPPIPDPRNSIMQMVAAKDQASFVWNQKMDTLPNTRFQYNSGHSEILDKIILQSTGKNTALYAKEKLFTPLGITDYYWKDGSFTEVSSPNVHYNKKEISLNLKAADMLKLGILILNKGEWNHHQLIDTTWLKKTLGSYFSTAPNISYGFQWYICAYPSGFMVYNTAGGGDQYISVIPELDMVVVTTANNFGTDNRNNGLLRFEIMQSNPLFKTILQKHTAEILKADTITQTSFYLSVISRDLIDCGLYEESNKLSDIVISRWDATYRTYLRKGKVCTILGQPDKATEMFQKSLTLNPGKSYVEKQDLKFCQKQLKKLK